MSDREYSFDDFCLSSNLFSASALLPVSNPVARHDEAKRFLDRFRRYVDHDRIIASDGSADISCRVDLVERRLVDLVEQTRAVLQSGARLDNQQLCVSSPRTTFKAVLQSVGLEVLPAWRSPYRVAQADFFRLSAVAAWSARIQIEAVSATQAGWFLVFDTLTYDPKIYTSEVMFAKHWIRYKKSVESAILSRVFGSMDEFSRSGKNKVDYVRYVAVPELHRDGRPHLHVLWFVCCLPSVVSDVDPNRFRTRCNRREVNDWPAFPYGFSSSVAVRYSGDSFTLRLNWVLPSDDSGQIQPLKPVVAVARYMAKYLDKPKPGFLKRARVRASRAFGVADLRSQLSALSFPVLLYLFLDADQREKSRYFLGVRLPSSFFRRLLQDEIKRRFKLFVSESGISASDLQSIVDQDSLTSPLLPERPTAAQLAAFEERLTLRQNQVHQLGLTVDDKDCADSFLADCAQPVFVGHAPTSRPGWSSVSLFRPPEP